VLYQGILYDDGLSSYTIHYKSHNNVVYSCTYYVVWCPKYRRLVLVNGIDARLKEIIQGVCAEYRADILQMEVMPDHVHFFARSEIDARPMADWVQMWKSVSSRQIAAALAIDPPIWQTDYFDRYLRSSEIYSEKWHYVEQNAVRAGLVETIDLWAVPRNDS